MALAPAGKGCEIGPATWSVSRAVGLIAGLACGLALGRSVCALLFEVTPFDVMSITLPIAMLLVAAVIAAILRHGAPCGSIPSKRFATSRAKHRPRAPCRNVRVVTCRSFPAWSMFFTAAASTTTSTTNCAFISSSGRKRSSPAG